MAWVHITLLLLAVPALLATGYLALLTALSWRNPEPPPARRPWRFDLVVPAHDERAGIQRTVKNLLGLAWPAEQFRVLVVADNCSDDTARLAAEAGATVLVRQDATRRGKGYALDLAFARSRADGFADAAVVVDADTVVTPNLLAAYAAHLEAGAKALQAEYAVLNPEVSWRTRLMAVAFSLFHQVRSAGRERLGVSCGLRGNGMCFALGTLERVPYAAFSIVEDIEYGIQLGRAGVRVHYVPEARAFGEMVASGQAAASQRRRWEGGRMALIRAYGAALLREALQRRDPILLDLALDVLVPPLSWIGAYLALGLAAALLAGGSLLLAAWLLPCAFVAAYVLRGVQVSGMGARALLALAWAPFYAMWKVLLLFAPRSRKGEWVRTSREAKDRGTG